MTLLLRTAGVAALGLAIASCGIMGGTSEEDEIRNVLRDFYRSFEDGDQEKLAGLLSGECDNADGIASRALASYERQGLEELSYNITGAAVRELTEDSAEALPEGSVRFEGGESPLTEANSEYFNLTKEDGDWKLADCNILFG